MSCRKFHCFAFDAWRFRSIYSIPDHPCPHEVILNFSFLCFLVPFFIYCQFCQTQFVSVSTWFPSTRRDLVQLMLDHPGLLLAYEDIRDPPKTWPVSVDERSISTQTCDAIRFSAQYGKHLILVIISPILLPQNMLLPFFCWLLLQLHNVTMYIRCVFELSKKQIIISINPTSRFPWSARCLQPLPVCNNYLSGGSHHFVFLTFWTPRPTNMVCGLEFLIQLKETIPEALGGLS